MRSTIQEQVPKFRIINSRVRQNIRDIGIGDHLERCMYHQVSKVLREAESCEPCSERLSSTAK